MTDRLEHDLNLPDGVTLDARAPFGSGGKEVIRLRWSNGLTLLFLEDHGAPVFSFQMWYKVGSAYERKEKTGLAHFFEHLMFKGTSSHPEGEFDRMMERHGAQTNAGTWLDWTFYYENLPAGVVPTGDPDQGTHDRGLANLEMVADFESDRMQNLVLEEGPFRSELEVVKNERLLRVDNDPEGKMDEELWSLSYKDHPYHWPTIGWMEHLEEMELEDARSFYKDFYAPNRAVMVLVGDLNVESTIETINRYFAGIPAQDIQRPPRATEAPQEGERRKTLSLPLAQERVLMGYRIPELTHPDYPALDVLCSVLFNAESARAERALVQKEEVALDVHGWVGAFQDPSLFQITSNCQNGRTAEEAIEHLDALLDDLKGGVVLPHEVDRARNKIRMSLLRSMLAAHSRAYQIGFYETTAGDFNALFRYFENLDAVTPDDVLRVAQTYLTADQRSVIIGLPAEQNDGTNDATQNPAPAMRSPSLGDAPLAMSGVANHDDDLGALGGEIFQFGPYDGILVSDSGVPHVAVTMRLRTGSQFDPEGKEGLARIAGEMLFRGTKLHNRQDLNEAIDAIGCSMNVRVQKSTMSVDGDVAKEHLPRFLELMCEVLFHPDFCETELEKLKRQTIGEISSISDDDSALARRGFGRTLFRNHPWSRPTMGTEESVQNIKIADIENFYAQQIACAARIIGVSGDTNVEEITALLGDFVPTPPVPVKKQDLSVGQPQPPSGRVVVLIDKPNRSQTQVIMGHSTIPAKHEDLIPLSIGNTAFGGTFTSRLMQEVRVKRGWSYGAYSSFSIGRDLSTFQAAFYPKTEDTIPAIELVLELLEDLSEHGMPEDHINFSKSFRTNAFAFSLETHFKRLSLLMSARYLERPDNWIIGHEARTQAVSAEHVRDAFHAHLTPQNMVISITCTADDLLEDMKKLPLVSEIYIQQHDKPWDPRRVFQNH